MNSMAELPAADESLRSKDMSKEFVRWLVHAENVGNSSTDSTTDRLRSIAKKLFIVCPPTSSGFIFGRALASRVKMEMPGLLIALSGGGLQERTAACNAYTDVDFKAPDLDWLPSDDLQQADIVFFALTSEALQHPLLLLEMAWCLGVDDRPRRRVAFIYDARSHGSCPVQAMLIRFLPSFLLQRLEYVSSMYHEDFSCFDYLDEFNEFCISAVLQWLHPEIHSLPGSSVLPELRHELARCAAALQAPPMPAEPEPSDTSAASSRRSSAKALMRRSSGSFRKRSPGRRSSSKKFTKAGDGERTAVVDTAFGLLHSGPRGAQIAEEVVQVCTEMLPMSVVHNVRASLDASESEPPDGRLPEQVANLLLVVTPGCLQDVGVVSALERASRSARAPCLVLLHDIHNVQSVWEQTASLSAALQTVVMSSVAVPWLDTLGFGPCLACVASTGLYQQVMLVDDTAVVPWPAGSGKIFDIFLDHHHASGLTWTFSLRMSLVRLAGTSFRSVLDSPSTGSSVQALGRLIERCRVHVVAMAPGFLTTFTCQHNIMLAISSGMSLVFVQHIDSCIDLEEELANVRCPPEEFLSSAPLAYHNAGGSAEFFASFQKVLFGRIWTSNCKTRPCVFSFSTVLERGCAEEILNNLRPGRLRRPGAPERFEHGVGVVHEFLQAGLHDCDSASAAFALIANQLLSGIGEQFCIAMLRTGTMKAFSKVLCRYLTPPIEGAIAHQALRALRALTECGSSAAPAMEQLMDTEDTAVAVKVMLEDAAKEPLLQPGVLEIAKVLLKSGSGMERVIESAGLGSFFKELLHGLRSDLEPLELVRERLLSDPASLDAASLKSAVVNWQGSKGSTSCAVPPPEVQEASLLLEYVDELQMVVIGEDGERATELLRDHLADLKRFKGIEELVQQAQAASAEFEAQKRFREEQLRSKYEAMEHLTKMAGHKEELAKVMGPVSDDLFETLGTYSSDLQFTKEALRVMQLVASSGKEASLLLAERGNAIPRIFSLLTPILGRMPATVSAPAGAARSAIQANGLQTPCLEALRLLKTLLIARRSAGPSFDRLFHRGVADNCAIVVSLLRCFPFSREIQMEAIQLLMEVASSDKDGAKAVGDSLAPTVSESSVGSNLILQALQRFHTDASDSTAIFGLAKVTLQGSHLFMGNLGPSMNIFVQEVLRCIKGHRDDADVECQALGVLVLLVATDAFNAAQTLLEANGIEILIGVATRHSSDDNVIMPARTAIAQIAKRCTSAFYNDIQVVVKRHSTNPGFAQEVCLLYAYILQSARAAGSNAEHVKLACKSGFLSGMLKVVWAQRGQKAVVCALPCALDLLITLGHECGAAELVREVAFTGHEYVVDVMLKVVERQLQDWDKQKQYAELAAAKDLPDWKAEKAPGFLTAAFRSLRGLLSAEYFPEVATSWTISMILQVLCKTMDHETLTAATSCLASILRLVEEHVCMYSLQCGRSSCTDISPKKGRTKMSHLAYLAQTLVKAERHGFAQWGTGNFLLAAAEFRNAEKLSHELREFVRSANPTALNTVEDHIQSMPFAQYAKTCMLHQDMIGNQTNSARTCARPDSAHADVIETEDDCMICLRPLGAPEGLWKCTVCRKCFHIAPCMRAWRRQHDNCPHCRSECGGDRRAFDPTEVPAYNRARAVAVAAEECLKTRTLANEGDAFLIATVASLWRTANGVGYRLQVPGTFLARDEQRAQEFEDSSRPGVRKAEAVVTEFVENFVKPTTKAAEKESLGYADTATAKVVIDGLTQRDIGVCATGDLCMPFRAALCETWGRTGLPHAGLSALCSVAAIMRNSQDLFLSAMPDQIRSHGMALPYCLPLVEALARNRLPYRVAVFLEAKHDLPFLAATFLWRFQQCGMEAHDSVFQCMDMIMQVLATSKAAENVRLRACLCRLVHDAIFVESRSKLTEERMLQRVQQEGSAREGATLEEWYVDTLLDSYGLSSSRAEILMSVGSDPFESLALLLDAAAEEL